MTTIGAYGLSLILRVILISSNIPGMTTDNLLSFLTNPLTLGLLFVYLLLLAFLVYLEFSLLVEIIECKEAKLGVGLFYFKERSRHFFKSISGWHFLAFLFYLILTIPFIEFLVSSAPLENLYIPNFISGELTKSTNGKIIYFGLYAIFAYLNLRFIYALPLAVTKKDNRFAVSLKESWQLTKGRKIFRVLGFGLVVIIISAIISLLSATGIGLAALVDGSEKTFWVETLFLSLVWGVLFAGRLVFKLALTGLLLLIGGINFTYNALKASGDPSKNLAVIGHRGMLSQGVENSLESLEASAKAGASYSELDIILSKDGHFIVSHDDNLKRLTGKNITISQSQAKDILGLKIKQNGYESHLVSFEDYVAKAKQLGIKLLVELKPTGNEPDNYEQLFVDKMKELHVDSSYLVMSADLKTIEKVKRLDSAIQSSHTISFQLGDFTSQKVNFYAIEDFSYNELLARKAHQNGKKIYVWTINSRDDIERYLETSTDSIITDYPTSVREIEKELAADDSYLDYFLRLTNLSWIEKL
ncbi:Membrane domain of membrane-anchored glycerophosphoryl diester phosphodiesterase [Streptococcus infantarius subsp. infantarius]|nr:Membrane domain of membrane-anchored glycerophosphoryl diester phosphodiesterase [Streptococcus infantarius subsp. infantarius]